MLGFGVGHRNSRRQWSSPIRFVKPLEWRQVQKTIYVSSTMLIGKKAGKFVLPGDKVQVRNPTGITSGEFTYVP